MHGARPACNGEKHSYCAFVSQSLLLRTHNFDAAFHESIGPGAWIGIEVEVAIAMLMLMLLVILLPLQGGMEAMATTETAMMLAIMMAIMLVIMLFPALELVHVSMLPSTYFQ